MQHRRMLKTKLGKLFNRMICVLTCGNTALHAVTVRWVYIIPVKDDIVVEN